MNLARLKPGLHRLLFVLLGAAIVGVSSERVFWYWASSPVGHIEVTLVYSLGLAFAVWLIDRFDVRNLWGFMLVIPAFAYIVEGIITPIMYTGGPFVPFFPVWFAAWHGLLGLGVLWYAMRRWLIDGRWAVLSIASVALGAFWGTWAITSLLPESVDDEEMAAAMGGSLQILNPGEFTVYAFTFTAILAGAHLLLGQGAWITSFRPGRASRWTWLALCALMLGVWTFVVPWAAPMFVAYLGVQLAALRRFRRGQTSVGPTLLEQLDGRFPARRVLPVMAMAPVAAATYQLWWSLELNENVIRGVFYYGTIGTQTVVGGVLIFMSLRRAFRSTPTDAVTGMVRAGEAQAVTVLM